MGLFTTCDQLTRDGTSEQCKGQTASSEPGGGESLEVRPLPGVLERYIIMINIHEKRQLVNV